MEGVELPPNRKLHLDGCPRCTATLTSMLSVHGAVTSLDADIPEPDWAEFRSSVRDRLLSRAAQRSSAVRRWTGWPIRPAAAWALSLVVAVGITTAAFLWNIERMRTAAEEPPRLQPPAIELTDVDTMSLGWSKAALFDDLIQLNDVQAEQVRTLLESSQKGKQYQQ
ncbi:MAG TPA: hypothetical protein VE422_03080 [Terriglobia bacterium]|nr:hypothetical protein [Terriglobia bacterium]